MVDHLLERVSLQNALEQPKQDDFSSGERATAVLLEGTFESIFKNRLNALSKKLAFRPESSPTKMLVISDGDIARNQIIRGAFLPLGYDNYEKRQYGNKDFILNSIDYLLEDEELINSLAMVCPFDSAEKQLIIEIIALEERTQIMIKIMDLNIKVAL